jgi:KDO2-lipid IV(A) lauroyltransferase
MGEGDLSVSSVRGQAVYLVYRGLGAGMRSLPEPLARASASAVGLALTAFRRDARALHARHLARVLGRPLSDREARAFARRTFRNYARYWLEGARLTNVPPQVILDQLVIESGFDYLVEHMAAGRGVVMALPHVGTWEWGGAWLALKGYPMTSVAEPVEPRALYDWFVSQREAMGLSIVPMGPGVGGTLLRRLRSGRLVGLLCDRDIMGNGVEVEFFGERTTLPGGPATLALRTGAALLPAAVYSAPGRGHTAVIMPPVATERTGSLRADVTRVTQALAADLETLIRRAPDQWYLFQPNWPSDPGYDR